MYYHTYLLYLFIIIISRYICIDLSTRNIQLHEHFLKHLYGLAKILSDGYFCQD